MSSRHERSLQLMAQARRRDTDGAIEELARTVDPAYRGNFLEPTRVDWRLLFGISRSDRVLEVGSNWGQLAFALAPWVGHLYSLEEVKQRVEFQRILLEKKAVPNLTLIHGQLRQLHFRPASMDWIFFSGVLERIGRADESSPRDVHAKVLLQAFEILKPGGHLVIAGTNKWGLSRKTADSGTRAVSYTLAGYRKLLAGTGAEVLQSYAPLPHFNRPRAIIPVEPPCPAAAQKFAVGQAWKRPTLAGALARASIGLLVHAGLMPRLYPYYFVVGRKPC